MTCPSCKRDRLKQYAKSHRCKCGFSVGSGDPAKVREVLRELIL